MPSDERFSEPLNLHLAYEFLPVQQQATILYAVGGTYSSIAEALWLSDPLGPEGMLPYSYWPTRELPPSPFPWYAPPLCIDTVSTGQSINFKFDVEKHFWPRFAFRKGNLDVMIPRWTAAAVVTGAVLVGGVAGYNQVLDTQIKRLEIQKLTEEIRQLREPIERGPHHRIEMHAQLFRAEIALPNIQSAEVNGVDVAKWRR